MLCRITDLHDKEVIDIATGNRLGAVDDVEVDTCSAQVCAIVIRGRAKCLGFLGHEEDIVIPWRQVEIVGDETVLVNHPELPCPRRKSRLLGGIFGR